LQIAEFTTSVDDFTKPLLKNFTKYTVRGPVSQSLIKKKGFITCCRGKSYKKIKKTLGRELKTLIEKSH
jgi:hypothetical protein